MFALEYVFVITKSEAFKAAVLPATVAVSFVVSACLTSLRITSLTAILTVFVVLPALAVIVTSPALTPVTSPVVASTVAIVSSLDENTTFVEAGLTVALTVSFAPTATSLAAFNVNVGFLTVIVAFNVFLTVFLAFLPVTLTLYPSKINYKNCVKQGTFILKKIEKYMHKQQVRNRFDNQKLMKTFFDISILQFQK